MKFNKNTEREQEIRTYLAANAFGSFFGMELHLSVVNTIPGITPRKIRGTGIEIETILVSISKKDKYQTNNTICISVHPLMDMHLSDKGCAS